MCRGICHFLSMSVMLMGALIVGAGMALLRVVQPSRVTREQPQVNSPRPHNQLTYFGDRGKHMIADRDMDLDTDMDLDLDSDFDMDVMNEDQSFDKSQELREIQGSNKKEIVFGHLTFLR